MNRLDNSSVVTIEDGPISPRQPESPLAAGDHNTMKLSARLKDGTPVGALFQAVLVADSH